MSIHIEMPYAQYIYHLAQWRYENESVCIIFFDPTLQRIAKRENEKNKKNIWIVTLRMVHYECVFDLLHSLLSVCFSYSLTVLHFFFSHIHLCVWVCYHRVTIQYLEKSILFHEILKLHWIFVWRESLWENYILLE